MALGRGPQLIPRSFGLFASEDEHFGLCAAGDLMGMHRSGTTFLARLLDRCGLFLGQRLESHHESVFFLHLNECIVRQARAS